ncbi:MAG: helix-turn-helix transcriptional regulator [Clostridia bacterium]|nr:helix-turn-helix transcriptional regulator [Clostridia bacterium]
MEINQIIAENLKKVRKENKMTQGELGDKIGYSDKTVSKWENGDSIPDVSTLFSIANLFNVTVDYFLHLDNSDKKYQVEKSNVLNKWLITLLGFSIIWLLVTVLFVYNSLTDFFQPAWLCFIWGIPVSCCELLYFNKLWGKRIIALILLTIINWTLITSIFLHSLLSSNGHNIWLIFIIGIPIQFILILWHNYRK